MSSSNGNNTAANNTAANNTAANNTAANNTVANNTVANNTVANDTVANDTAANDTVRDFWLGRRGVNSTATAPPEIQQSELARYKELQDKARELKRLRESIRDRLQRGRRSSGAHCGSG
jgi:transcriptional antiterminator NusG